MAKKAKKSSGEGTETSRVLFIIVTHRKSQNRKGEKIIRRI